MRSLNPGDFVVLCDRKKSRAASLPLWPYLHGPCDPSGMIYVNDVAVVVASVSNKTFDPRLFIIVSNGGSGWIYESLLTRAENA